MASRAGVSLKTQNKCGFGHLSSGLLLIGLGQESGREGEVVSWEAVESPRVTLSRCKCQKALFAAIAQDFGREGLHNWWVASPDFRQPSIHRDTLQEGPKGKGFR